MLLNNLFNSKMGPYQVQQLQDRVDTGTIVIKAWLHIAHNPSIGALLLDEVIDHTQDAFFLCGAP